MQRAIVRSTALFCVFALCFVVSTAAAQDHVVPASQLHHALQEAAAARQKNIARVESFFASKPARQALMRGGLNLKEVQQAVPQLNNEELARLATQTQKIQNNFAAGALSAEHLTYIVIALATAVVVILILKA